MRLYAAAIAVASLFHPKAKQLYKGRQETFKRLRHFCAHNDKIIWFHCASLGEYEQGKPMIQKLRECYPDRKYLVSFFSPSGYEIKKGDADIDAIVYLPADTPHNAKLFLQIVRPERAFFVKYEYWYNFMHELQRQQIPFYYLSAIFRPKQYFFRFYGGWFVQHLRACSHLFVQNEESQRLLNSVGIHQVTITGDTRFDRVYAIAQQGIVLPFVETFKGDKKLIVAGSTWAPDEELLAKVFHQINHNYKIIIAPHLIDPLHIKRIKELFAAEKVVAYSEQASKNLSDYNVLIVDTIGVLNKIYRYAEVAYIGGAFATGLHNTLEAAVFGMPLFFGPHYHRFNEAVELVRLKGAFSIQDAEGMLREMNRMTKNEEIYRQTCKLCKHFVQQNLGACDRIIEVIRTSSAR